MVKVTSSATTAAFAKADLATVFEKVFEKVLKTVLTVSRFSSNLQDLMLLKLLMLFLGG
jgi:hypothetical protein